MWPKAHPSSTICLLLQHGIIAKIWKIILSWTWKRCLSLIGGLFNPIFTEFQWVNLTLTQSCLRCTSSIPLEGSVATRCTEGGWNILVELRCLRGFAILVDRPKVQKCCKRLGEVPRWEPRATKATAGVEL